MMNDEKFKNAYRASENEVPVNLELKRRLIEMAKECEQGETRESEGIRLQRKNRKNIRSVIIRTAAMAACFALCISAVPRLTEDGYFGGGEIRETQATEQNDDVYQDEKENNTVSESEESHEKPISTERTAENSSENKTNKKTDKTTDKKTEQGTSTAVERNSSRTGNNSAADTVTAKSEDSATGEIKDEYKEQTQPETTAQEQGLSNEERVKDTATEDETDITDRDELNNRLKMLDKQTAKLDSWDSELKRYTGEDSVYDSAYEGFKEKKNEYGNAAESYKAEYSGAETESELKKGAEEYDARLSDNGTLFNDCREGYRKCANYAEMNGMEPNETEDKVIADEE